MNNLELSELDRSQIEKNKAIIRKVTAEAERHEYEAERTRKDLDVWNASADEARIYHFFGAVDASNVMGAIDVIGNWSRRKINDDRYNNDKEFTIVFNSPGGSVIHGLALYDFLTELKENGHKLTTITRGMAASMGGILLQAGNERVVGANSHMLIHEISSIGVGKMSELEDEIKFLKRLQDRSLNILAERSNLSKSQIKTQECVAAYI